MNKKKHYAEIEIEIYFNIETNVICSSPVEDEIGQEWNSDWN